MMGRTGSGLCPMAAFSITSVESPGSSKHGRDEKCICDLSQKTGREEAT
jgi:hypothetical protein